MTSINAIIQKVEPMYLGIINHSWSVIGIDYSMRWNEHVLNAMDSSCKHGKIVYRSGEKKWKFLLSLYTIIWYSYMHK